MFLKHLSFFFSFSVLLCALSLDEAVHNALSISPEILEKEKRYEEIFNDIEVAKAGYLPKIDLRASSSIYNSRVKKALDKRLSTDLLLSQNLFNGFGDINKQKLELSKYKSAFYTVLELKNSYSLEVISAYLNLLRQKELLDIQESSIQNHTTIFEKIIKKYNLGAGNRLEYRLSQTSLDLAKINFYEQENTLKEASILFEKYVNNKVLANELDSPYYMFDIPSTLESAIELAFKKHPSLHVAILNEELTRHELEYTKKDFYPSVDLLANYYGEKSSDTNIFIDDYYEVKVELSYNLYNGEADSYSQRKIEQKISQKKALIDKAKRDIHNKVQSKYNAYVMLKGKTVLLGNYLKSKELTLESFYDSFSIGQAQLRDILDTTESLYNAKKMYLNGHYDFLIAQYALLESMGLLTEFSYAKKSKDELEISKEKSIKSDILGVYKKDNVIYTQKEIKKFKSELL